MLPNRIRQKLNNNEIVFGAALQLDSPWLVEMCGMAGFDYVMLDGEHGFASYNMPNLILAANAAGISPIVRVPNHDRGFILPAMDAGAGGIHIPMVNDPEQARALVKEVKYEPIGNRGFSMATRASGYGSLSREAHVEAANRDMLLMLTLETVEAIRHAGEIADIPGVDMIFIGRDDLAESFGVKDRNAPEVREAIRQVLEQVGGKVPVGTTAFSTEDVRLWTGLGVRFLLTGTTRTIRIALENVYGELRKGLSSSSRLEGV
ncbi:HpcH/HpaI aldolase family protein [Paenibacillus sp. FSL H8-0034]|uniref:HpcH/HpaI aldolase family protein n=1 Tax=Paenibacillus sp. FSL H8-0034 TaxID=2954671 RepID=UPI0030F4D15E